MSKSAVDHMDVRWRVAGTTAWSAPQSTPPNAEVIVEGLERDKQYEFEARNVSACGAPSVWVASDYIVPAAPTPPAVVNLVALSLADGVHLSWDTNGVQAAGIIYRIERASAEAGPFTQRAIMRSNAYTDAETTGTTYWYRVCAMDFAENKGTYSNVVDSAGAPIAKVFRQASVPTPTSNNDIWFDTDDSNAPYVASGSSWVSVRDGTILSAANNANDARAIANSNAPLVPNGNFANGLTGWTAATGWTSSVDGALFTGFAGQTYSDLTGTSIVPVKPGQMVYVQALLEATGATGTCLVALSWRKPDGSQLIANGGTSVTGTSGPTLCTLRLAAPAGAAGVLPLVEAHLVTTGTIIASQVAITLSAISTQDDLPDGTTRFAAVQAGADKTSSNTAADTAKVNGVSASSISPIGALMPSEAGSERTTGKSITVLTGRTLDNIADSVTFQRVGTGYADGSGRIVKLWDGTAIRQAVDVWDGANRARTGLDGTGALVQDKTPLTRLTGRTLDNIADTSSYRRVAATGPAGDRLENGDFRSPPDADGNLPGWAPFANSGSLPTITREYVSGEYRVKITGAAGSTNAGIITDTTLGVKAGESVAASADVYTDTGGLSYILIGFYSGAGSQLDYAQARQSNFDIWERLAAVKTAPAGTGYARVLVYNSGTNGGITYCKNVRASVNDLRVAGSEQMLGDQRNAPSSLTRNLGIVRSATALTAASTGAVGVNAHDIYMGTATIHYNAVSNAVTGLTQGDSYYIYARDNYAGGSPTWNYATSATAVNSYDDAYNAGVVTIPTSGSSGGGAGGGIPGDDCVGADMWLRRGLTARMLAKHWRWWRPTILRGQDGWHFVRHRPRIVRAQCCRITVADGATLDCSNSTPVTVHGGESILAPMLHGHLVMTDSGWQRVINVELLRGDREVVRICVGGHSFFAGFYPSTRISTHNVWKK